MTDRRHFRTSGILGDAVNSNRIACAQLLGNPLTKNNIQCGTGPLKA